MFDEIIAIIKAGSSISHSYKKAFSEWMDTVKIFTSNHYGSPMVVVQHPQRGMIFFDSTNINDAVACFCKYAYGKENMSNAIGGMQDHGIFSMDDIEDMSKKDFLAMVERYNRELYDTDFPFAKEFADYDQKSIDKNGMKTDTVCKMRREKDGN